MENNANEISSGIILPFLKVFTWSPLVSGGIEFNETDQVFVWKKGSFLKRIVSFLWLLLMTTYLLLIFINHADETKSPTTAILTKISWGTYTVFDAAFIYAIRFRGRKIAHILNEGSEIWRRLRWTKKGGKALTDMTLAWLTCLLTIAFVIVFVFVIIINLVASTTDLYNEFLKIAGLLGKDRPKVDGPLYNPKNYKEYWWSIWEICWGKPTMTLLFTLWFMAAYSVEFMWIIYLWMGFSWGVYFRRMFQKCIDSIEEDKVKIGEVLDAYVNITSLLEEFNGVFGEANLWIVISLGFYIAFIVGETMAMGARGVLFDGVNFGSIVPFLCMVQVASDVNRMNHRLVLAIKRKWHTWDKGDWKDVMRLNQGISMIQFDALNNNVGIKGMEFFTLSYGFVGSLIGAIITYSLVTMQFKLKET